MRVAITSNTLTAGGAERQRTLLANGFARRGHDVQLVLLQSAGPLADQLEPSVAVRRVWERATSTRCDLLISGTTNTETVFALRERYVRRSAAAWAVAVHNPMGPSAPRLKSLAARGVRFADGVIALSAWHGNAMRQDWRLEPTHVIPNGVPEEQFSSVREERRTSGSFAFDVGYLGRLSSHHKGLDVLLQAWRDQPRRLGIAGEGEDEVALRVLAENAGVADRATFMGLRTPQDFFRDVEVLILPSRYEGQPMVVLEALAAGVPVIGSIAGGMADVLPRSRVIEPLTPANVSAVVDAYFAEPELTRRTIEGPVPTVEAMIDGYEAMAEDLLGDRRRSARA